MSKRRPPDPRAKRTGKRPDTRTTPQGETLSAIDEQFCRIYLQNGMNAAEAYRRTHPNASKATSQVNGPQTLGKTSVQTWLSGKLAPVLEKDEMTPERLIEEIRRCAIGDRTAIFDTEKNTYRPMKDWPVEVRALIEAVEFNEDGTIHKVKLTSKNKAMELGARYHGILQERSLHINADLDLGSMTSDQIKSRLRTLAKEMERGERVEEEE